MGPPPAMPVLLCLHGSHQSGEVFSQRTATLGRKAAHLVRLELPDGLQEMPLREGDDLAMRTWWRHSDDPAAADPPAEVDAAVQFVLNTALSLEGCVGLLGFSQGAALCAYTLRALADAARSGTPHPAARKLRFAILCGAPECRTAIPTPIPCSAAIPTLHCGGEMDTLVPWRQSEGLSKKFHGAEFFRHDGGHAVPQGAAHIGRLIDFIRQHTPAGEAVGARFGSREEYLGNEVLLEELSGLRDIYGEDFAWEEEGGDISRAALSVPTNSDDAVMRISLRFPTDYPEYPPELSYEESGLSRVSKTRRWHAAFRSHADELFELHAGDAMCYPVLEGLKEFLQDHPDDAGLQPDTTETPASDEPRRSPSTSPSPAGRGASAPAEPPRPRLLTLEGESEETREASAKAAMASLGVLAITEQDWAESYGKGGRWSYTIGLVGKPSAGKSTLFNAATGDATAAKVAAHPFTTIEPNTGVAHCGVPCPCMPSELPGGGQSARHPFFEAHPESVPCGAEHGHTASGQRFIPLSIRDVAGLVPGAYQGRGKGNKFLDDLNDADVLVHVVDASGMTNAEGQRRDDSEMLQKSEDGATAGSLEREVLKEVHWVRLEIHQWIYTNVLRKWEAICRRPEKLPIMFTGYHATVPLVMLAARKAGISPEQMEHPALWEYTMLHRLVAAFIRIRFPVVIAMNKCDVPSAKKNVEYVRQRLPTETVVELSADLETQLLKLRDKGLIRYKAGGLPEGEVPQHIVNFMEGHGGSTGVVSVLSTAIALRPTTRVFPVTDPETMASYGGGVLQHCFHLIPGSSAADLYRHLSHGHFVEGDFVRSTVIDAVSGADGIFKKDHVLPQGSVVRIMTNRKSKWQSGHREQQLQKQSRQS